MSIDGFIADSDNSLDWLFQAGTSPAKESHFSAFFGQVGAMAMGATTYLWALEHEQLLENPGTWREYYGTTPCWIFTHRELPAVPGADLRFVQGQIPPVHEQMVRAAEGKNVWVVGGGDLAGQFADHGLIDELLLGVAPAILGAGAPLLPRRLPPSSLALTAVEHDQRFTFLTYQVIRPESSHR
jgi:dihydrofolate reductase